MARRRWDLADDKSLRYSQMYAFDRAMHDADDAGGWTLDAPPTRDGVNFCESRQLIWFCRGGVFFVFNFHPSQDVDANLDFSCSRHSIKSSKTILILSTDELSFGGQGRGAELQIMDDTPLSDGLDGSSIARARARIPSFSACAFDSTKK